MARTEQNPRQVRILCLGKLYTAQVLQANGAWKQIESPLLPSYSREGAVSAIFDEITSGAVVSFVNSTNIP